MRTSWWPWGDKVEPGIRYEALYARALSYAGLNVKDTEPCGKGSSNQGPEAALLGLKTLDELKKPDKHVPEDFYEAEAATSHSLLITQRVTRR